MKFIIAGSRKCGQTSHMIYDYSLLVDIIDNIIKKHSIIITQVISGNANGPDKAGEYWANENGIELIVKKPDWSIGRHAGLIRNQQMAAIADGLIALYDGSSKGTMHMISTMRKDQKPVYVEIVN